MKRVLPRFLVLCCVLAALLTGMAFAAETAGGDEGPLHWSFDDSGVLTVSGSGAMTDYAARADAPWYAYRARIVSVVIGEGVTSVGSRAFESTYGALASVTLPSSLTKIGDMAFYSCPALESVSIPAGVTEIGSAAFAGCASLTAITVEGGTAYAASDGVLFSGSGARLLCYPAGKTAASYTIPDTVTVLNTYSFAGNTALVNLTIPMRVGAIGMRAFDGCTNLTAVSYGGLASQWAAVTIGADNEPLTNAAITYAAPGGEAGDGVTWSLSDAGVLTIRGSGAMADNTFREHAPWYSYRASITSAVIESGVTAIGAYAFYGCAALERVTIPETVAAIGSFAFYNCAALERVSLPAGVAEIGSAVFAGCASLTAIDAAGGAYTSADGVLFGENGVRLVCYPAGKTAASYAIPDTVTVLNNYSFAGNTALVNLTIPMRVGVIGTRAFEGCANLTAVTYGGLASQWAAVTVGADNEPLTNASFTYAGGGSGISGEAGSGVTWTLDGDGVLTIRGTGAMTDYTAASPAPWYQNYHAQITSVVIGDGVTAIGDRAFYNCPALERVTMPNSVVTIGAYAFFYCTALTDAALPSSLTEIGSFAFYRCDRLPSVTLPAALTALGSAVFARDAALTGITAAGGNTAFQGTDGVLFSADGKTLLCYPAGKTGASYAIPDGVAAISARAFEGNPHLRSLTVPSSVRAIGTSAFEDCELTDALFEGLETQWTAMQSSIGDGNNALLDVVTFPEAPGGEGWSVEGGVLTIHADFEMEDYAEKGAPWYALRLGITAIRIESGVTSIGKYAFYHLTRVESVTIPSSVTGIGAYAFCYCTALTDAALPSSLTEIGSFAFYRCDSLPSVTLPAALTVLESAVFAHDAALTGITVAGGNIAFRSADGVLFSADGKTLLCYPAGKTGASYTIPDGVAAISARAFEGNPHLTSVTIPASVQAIGGGIFEGCASLSDVYYEGDDWDSVRGSDGNAGIERILRTDADTACALTGIAAGKNSASVTVVMGDETTATLIVAAYQNGRCLAVAVRTVSRPANGNAVTQTAALRTQDADTVTAFLLNPTSSAPLCASRSCTPGE